MHSCKAKPLNGHFPAPTIENIFMKLLKIIFFLLLLVSPVFDYIYKWTEEGSSPALILRAVAAVLMIFMLLPRSTSLGKGIGITKTVTFLIFYIGIVTFIALPNITSLHALIRVLYSFLGFLFIYHLAKTSSITEKELSTFFMLLLVILAITAYLNIGHRLDMRQGLNRADNTGYSLVCAYASVMFFVNKKTFPLSLLLVIVGTLLCGKRGAIIAMSMATLPVLIYIFMGEQIKISKKFMYIFFIVISSFFVLQQFTSYFDATLGRFERLGEDHGSGRDQIYSLYFEHFKNSDLIHQVFGHGLSAGTYGANKPFAFTETAAHSDWLEMLYDFGIVGTLAYAIVFIQLLGIIFQNRKNKNKYYYMLVMSFIIWFIKSIVSSTFLLDISSIYLYMTTAYAISRLELDFHNCNDNRQLYRGYQSQQQIPVLQKK